MHATTKTHEKYLYLDTTPKSERFLSEANLMPIYHMLTGTAQSILPYHRYQWVPATDPCLYSPLRGVLALAPAEALGDLT